MSSPKVVISQGRLLEGSRHVHGSVGIRVVETLWTVASLGATIHGCDADVQDQVIVGLQLWTVSGVVLMPILLALQGATHNLIHWKKQMPYLGYRHSFHILYTTAYVQISTHSFCQILGRSMCFFLLPPSLATWGLKQALYLFCAMCNQLEAAC
jgi:hypothetical protein